MPRLCQYTLDKAFGHSCASWFREKCVISVHFSITSNELPDLVPRPNSCFLPIAIEDSHRHRSPTVFLNIPFHSKYFWFMQLSPDWTGILSKISVFPTPCQENCIIEHLSYSAFFRCIRRIRRVIALSLLTRYWKLNTWKLRKLHVIDIFSAASITFYIQNCPYFLANPYASGTLRPSFIL